MGERHVRIEISDFVMRTFVLSQAAFAKGLEIRCSVGVCAIRLQVRSYTGALFEKKGVDAMFSFEDTTVGHILMTFLISMVPVLELRAAIPAGVIAGLDIKVALLTAVIGNLVPIPFIIVFIRKIFKWMQSKSERLAKIVKHFEEKAESKKAQVLRYEFWGLMIFVAIPLPGTGAWSGALVAAMLDMQLKRAFPAITAGVLIAGIIVTSLTYGISALA